MMHFCQFCSTIPLRLFSTCRNEQGYHDHHLTFEDLKASASAGRRGCKLFVYHRFSKEAYNGEHLQQDFDYLGEV